MAAQNLRPELSDQPMGELFKRLSNELSTLVRQELKLAQAEMAEKGKKAGLGAGLFGGAGILGLFGLATLTACVIAAISLVLQIWLAALIVGAFYATVAGGMALVGKSRVSAATPPVPEQTVETVKEDLQWAKTQLPSARR